jgi:hypothetical protein
MQWFWVNLMIRGYLEGKRVVLIIIEVVKLFKNILALWMDGLESIWDVGCQMLDLMCDMGW